METISETQITPYNIRSEEPTTRFSQIAFLGDTIRACSKNISMIIEYMSKHASVPESEKLTLYKQLKYFKIVRSQRRKELSEYYNNTFKL